jgi:hypothetical protein
MAEYVLLLLYLFIGDDNEYDFLFVVVLLMDFPLAGDVSFFLGFIQSDGYNLLRED